MDIRNMPAKAAYYEFVVAIPNADHYTFSVCTPMGIRPKELLLNTVGL